MAPRGVARLVPASRATQLCLLRCLGLFACAVPALGLAASALVGAAQLAAWETSPRGPAWGLSPRSRCMLLRRRPVVALHASTATIDALDEFDGDLAVPLELLGLGGSFPQKGDVRAAFRRAAREEHPDVSDRADADERFRRVSLAFELLMDDEGRTRVKEALVTKAAMEAEMKGTELEVEVAEEAFAFIGLIFGMVLFALVWSSCTGVGDVRW
mmetsp:Transcript_28449/g.64411  ORF Transcript_28449/g.64411 Transcript_28449/m.64411 type:complete len:214 (+) Transcript_28449:65-706(+)